MGDLGFDAERRKLLRVLVAAPVILATGLPLRWLGALAASASTEGQPQWARLGPTPTPDCDDGEETTPSETEGPFFKPRSPRRASLREAGMKGVPLVLTGRVFARNCRPVAGALLDFWHADDEGEYDNEGFRLRGHQFADAQGKYHLETIVPGTYGGRTRHIHVKVQAPQRRVLTTQLYFPGEPRNQSDGLFRSDLLVALKRAADAKQARFHFILDVD